MEIWRNRRTTVQNNIFFKNQKALSFSSVENAQVDYNLFDEVSAIMGPHDLQGAAGFVNYDRGIFWLSEKSSDRERGNPNIAPEFDLRGHPRRKGKPSDLGAYEFFKLPFSEKVLKLWQYRSRWEAKEDIPDPYRTPDE